MSWISDLGLGMQLETRSFLSLVQDTYVILKLPMFGYICIVPLNRMFGIPMLSILTYSLVSSSRFPRSGKILHLTYMWYELLVYG